MLRKLINLFLQQMINKKSQPFQVEAIDPFYKIGVKTEKELIEDEE